MLSTESPAAFALAKIQPPRPRTSLVERPTLEQALDTALRHHRLTLLVAPAGYGKTAALTRQIRLLPQGSALAWISIDEDDQLQRFLACLTTALEPHDLPWRVSPEALGTLAQAEHGLRDVARELVNALAATEVTRGLIVIDDAHRLSDPQVFELLQAVIERLPEHWGVAIASRLDPPLSLARWRVSGDLAEFRQYDLRFNETEVDALVHSSGVDASSTTARQLLALTEGWAVGLRLSLSSLAGSGPGAGRRSAGGPAQRHLFDYLASEVLDDMPADLRGFLLRCSVLPELTAARCEHVSRLPDAARLLEEVERRGLFVSTLDAEELTLRLHDLFRDFLESRLQRDHPGELPYLLRRAADHEDDLVRAVGYLTRAGAWDEAARALVERGPALITRGGGPAVEQMLAQFPPEQVAQRPGLHFLRGGAAFPRFDFNGMVDAMQQAADGYARAGQSDAAALAQTYASLGRQNTGALGASVAELDRLREQPLEPGVRAFVCFSSAWAAYAQGRGEDVAPHVHAMLKALEQAADPQVWDRCFFVSILTGLPVLRPLLERFADGAMRLTSDQPTQLRAGVMHIRTWLAFSKGRVDEAAQWLSRADEDCRWLGRPRSLMTENWMAHTLIDAVRGDRDASYAAAQENKRDLEEHAFRSNRLTHEYEELFTFIRAAWVLGDGTMLRTLAPLLERTGNPHEWAAADADRALARAMLADLDGRLEDAQTLLQPLACDIERSCFFPAAQARLMLAYVQLRRGRIDDAAATLAPWLAAALNDGDVGGALLAGRPALQRLATADWGLRLAPAAVGLLADLAKRVAGGPVTPDRASASSPIARPPATGAANRAADSSHTSERLVGLTEREREVLSRMAAGDSNKLIARRFDLSPHTVKRHVANILDKLGVDTRGQAAARWRESAELGRPGK
jgi:LuxR family maltose regulon positive regulatory protein